MTTIPTHNIVIQQSGTVHEATHHVKPLQPDPEQMAQQQAARETTEKTTVLESNASSELKADTENQKQERERKQKKANQKKESEEREQDPDATGRLLDTVV